MSKKNNRIRVNPVAEKIVKSGLKIVFRNMFNVRLNMPDEVVELKPPFVLLPNHQGFWDPFLAGIYLKPPVYYITSDAVFRSRLFGFLLRFLGAIPKTKSQSDLDALKNIFEMKEQGHSIGIFAEGQRTWDGRTLPLIKSTAKLIRMLKIPVVSVVFKGGYFSQPRWGTSVRKGELLINYQLLFRGDEVGRMKISDIHSRITEALRHDEAAYQKQTGIEFREGKLAENIEQFLFICPSCGVIKGFYSKKDSFECLNCRKTWRINNLQEVSSEDGEGFFDNVRDWDSWQQEQLYNRIDLAYDSEEIIFEDQGLVFHTGFKSKRLRLLAKGTLRLNSREIQICDKKNVLIKSIPLRELSGINVQNKEVLDFYFENILYTVRDPENRFSSYKYWRAIDYLQRQKIKMNLPD